MKSKSQIITKSRSDRGMPSPPLVARRLPAQRPPTCPGEMLSEEFLKPLGITQSAFAVGLESRSPD